LEVRSHKATDFAPRCRGCAHVNATGARFCTSCGARLDVPCAACGRGRPPDAQFCGWCGTPATETTRLTETGGERKQATVLFADIVGSTELIAGLDAEAAKDRLLPAVKAMALAVRGFDGTVLRTLGDGLKAAFGVPQTREGHALLACRAALAIRDAIEALPDATRIRIGIHSGEVVASLLDTGSAVEQDVQGMTVHLASRIEQAAEPGEIHISGQCWALVGAYCDAVRVGTLTVRGNPEDVQVYRLTGLKPAVGDHFRDGLTPLRGRTAELEILRQALVHAGQGGPNVVGISGEAGAGKSRLCLEFDEWCRGRRVAPLEARANVVGQASPLLPILQMLNVFFRVSPGLDPEEARRRISWRLLALDASLADGLPILCEFLDVASAPPDAKPRDPRTRHMQLRNIVGRMAKAAGKRHSVIIFEDLHWLDEASQDFVETIAEAARGTKLVMIVTFRPPWSSPSLNGPDYREIALPVLGLDDMHQIVRDLTGESPSLQRMVSHVANQSGGNPFFAQELVLSLAQTGVLLGARGRYKMPPGGWHDPVLPATVEAVIGARIDYLAEDQKAVLQIGAVIGKEFPAVIVREVAGIAEPGLGKLFGQLCDAEMIHPCATYAGPGFAFRHPLIQRVAYQMQLRARRTPLHASVADAIKRFDWGLRDDSAGLLAHHYEAAGQMLEAAMHLQRAARWIGRTNSARALLDWKRVRLLMRGQPRSRKNDQLRALACGQILSFGWREGLPADEAKLYAEEALDYARANGDRSHEVRLLGAYGRIMATNSSADEYVGRVREALALAAAGANPESDLLLNGLLCQACGRAGLLWDALAANDAALAAIESPGDPYAGAILGISVGQMVGFDIARWVRCLRAGLLVALGQFDEAELWLGRLMQIEDVTIEPIIQYIPHYAAVELAWHRGDTASAKTHTAEVVRYAEQSAIPFILVTACLCQGLSASADGDFAGAERHFLTALETARDGGAGLDKEARLLAHLAETFVLAGESERATDIAAEAIEKARRRTDRYAECHANIAGAMALAAHGRVGRSSDAAAMLGRADALIALTGAAVFQPMSERARLLIDPGELFGS
jgi:class 3 adenylate cyclase/tetratricopeptide (TPR) repeat protein